MINVLSTVAATSTTEEYTGWLAGDVAALAVAFLILTVALFFTARKATLRPLKDFGVFGGIIMAAGLVVSTGLWIVAKFAF